MCGIAGIISAKRGGAELLSLVKKMAGSIVHRGPDHGAFLVEEEVGIALCHRRLAIIDIGSSGEQPMTSKCGRYSIVYNGEIYNFLEIKASLKNSGVLFSGSSDTEAFLEYIAKYGVAKACKTANGMFAFAVWDRKDRVLSLGRDRFGQKPLYYGFLGKEFYFASELKAIHKVAAKQLTRNNEALSLFFRLGYITGPRSIYNEISKLMPGNIATISYDNLSNPMLSSYWSAMEQCAIARADPFHGSQEEAEIEFEHLASDAVSKCMISDVPLGSLLSGGFDSSLVSALMQKHSLKPIETFSIGFDNPVFDESQIALKVAKHLGTNHTSVKVSNEDALNTIPLLADIYDEPFADSSQIPTFLVSRMARQNVTVALTGDGGDEIFGGYTRYAVGNMLQKIMQFPAPLRHLAANALIAVPPKFWDQVSLMTGSKIRLASDKAAKLAILLKEQNFAASYVSLTSSWQNPAQILPTQITPSPLIDIFNSVANFGNVRSMMLTDTLTYLPDDILVKVDRASMSTSLETRIPLLDHSLLDFSWRLPIGYLTRNRVGKQMLRNVTYKYIPREIIDRPKMGFAIPLNEWLRGPLRGWAEELMKPNDLEASGLENQKIQEMWRQHLSGDRDWQHPIWTVLMYREWERRWI